MNTIDDSGVYQALGLSPTAAPKKDSLGQDEYLKLMVTQLQNQDPFKPMESGDFLGQIAQFGTVSGISDLQKSFSEFSASLYSNQALQASGLVGRTVLAPSGSGDLPPGGVLSGAVDLPASSNAVTVNVYTQNGELVRRIPLGPQASGLAQFQWDGLAQDGTAMPAGKYLISAEAAIDGSNRAVDTLVSASVQSVSLGGAKGLLLNLAGAGTLDFASVRQIM
jgi:flagellar basal-body rod modification protein FlgD